MYPWFIVSRVLGHVIFFASRSRYTLYVASAVSAHFPRLVLHVCTTPRRSSSITQIDWKRSPIPLWNNTFYWLHSSIWNKVDFSYCVLVFPSVCRFHAFLWTLSENVIVVCVFMTYVFLRRHFISWK